MFYVAVEYSTVYRTSRAKCFPEDYQVLEIMGYHIVKAPAKILNAHIIKMSPYINNILRENIKKDKQI